MQRHCVCTCRALCYVTATASWRATTGNKSWLTPCHLPSFAKQTQLTSREIRFSGGYRVSATCVTPKWNYQLIIICRRSAVCICWGFIPHGTARAARSLLNFHWFPPDCLCESGSQPPSIRKDVKYRARRTRIESGREGGGEREGERLRKAGKKA